MANNYIRPLLAVYQQLEITLAATGDHLHACVIGPNYDLYRYGLEDIKPHKFTTDSQDISFEYEREEINDYEVDTKTVNVYADGLEAHLASMDGIMVVDSDDIMTLRVKDPETNGYLFSTNKGTTLLTDLHGLGVEVGDIFYVTAAAAAEGEAAPAAYRRVVTDLAGKVIPSEASDGELYKGSTATTAVIGTDVTLSDDTDYNGKEDTTFIVEVKAADNDTHKLTLSVTDTAGLFGVRTVNVADFTSSTGVEIGHGLKLDFAGTAETTKYSVGDVLSFNAIAKSASTVDFDGVVLTAAPIDVNDWDTYKETALTKVELRKQFSGDLDSVGDANDPWTIETSTTTGEPVVRVAANLSVSIPGRDTAAAFVDSIGDLYVSFRVLIQADPNEDIFYIDTEEDIKDYFGTISQENELAYAAYWCFKGAQGRGIYALRTRGTDVDSFHAAIEKTESMTETYSVAVISSDPDVIADIVEFNDKLSQPEVKRWRRTICGVDSPGQYRIASRDLKNNQLKAKIAPYSSASSAANVLLQIPNELDFDLTNVTVNGNHTPIKAGDKIKLETSNRFFTVKTVLSPKELLLTSGPVTPISIATPISIWKADTAVNNVDYIGALAGAFNSRRVTVVWCDNGVLTGSSDVVENRFIAAEVAGISSAVVPQAGITRTEVQSVTNAVRMYTKYRQDQLDDIASKGVMIITQDSKGAPCYIRHQLTTEMDKGSLYYEESPTRNLDNISYALVDILEGFIGKANVTPSALTAIKVALIDKLNEFTQDSPDPMIGPSLVSWDSLTVIQDPDFKDRVISKVHLYLPLPLNGIRLYEMAYAATVTI